MKRTKKKKMRTVKRGKRTKKKYIKKGRIQGRIQGRVPPSGVILRKNGRLFKSDGQNLKAID